MTDFSKRILIILTLAAVCCFAFAGVASASMTVYADGETYTCVEAQDVSYTFDIANERVATCLNQVAYPVVVNITVPSGITPDVAGRTIPVKILVRQKGAGGVFINEGVWYYAQPTAVVNGQVVSLALPTFIIPNASQQYATRWIIGDVEQDLNADNGCPGGSKGFDVHITTACSEINESGSIFMKDIPEVIDLQFTSAPITACTNETVEGWVYLCDGTPWACYPVDVWFSTYCDECGEDGCGGPALTGTVQVLTDSYGHFTATLPAPPEVNTDYGYCGGRTYKINAQPNVDNFTNLFCETVPYCEDVTVEPNAPQDLQWAYFNEDTGEWEPVCEGLQLALDECQLMRVYLLDTCDVPNVCGDHFGNITKATVDRKVYLTGIESQSDTGCVDTVPPMVGAHFYLPGQCDANQINQITILADHCYAEVEVQPIVDGYVKLTASSDFPLASLTPDSVCAHIYNPNKVELVGTALVTDAAGDPRGGWVYQEAIWLGENLCPCAEDTTVMVEFRNESGLTATWGTAYVDTYNYTGPYVSGQTYNFGDFNNEKDCKTHFYIYTNPYSECQDPCNPLDECDDPLYNQCTPDCDWTGSLEVRVKITCATTGITYASEWQLIEFATPVEDYRHLAADKWQIITTPKALAGAGDVNFLLGADNVKAAYFFSNGTWYAATGPMYPLAGYYVRTAQADCNILNQQGYDAKYIFKRANKLGDTAPPTKSLGSGWNFVGVGAAPDINGCTTEATDAYHWLGSACTMCKKAYNPGAASGNLAPWNNLAIIADGMNPFSIADMAAPVLNGDGYWLWTSGTGTLVGDTGYELLKQ
jgi:hypothetical protein